MTTEELPPRGRNQTTEEFDRRRRNGFSGLIPPAEPISSEPFQTPISTDIGNFFKVLLAFLSGLWNRDFAEFDLLSSVYFPPTEQPQPGTPQAMIRGRVDTLRDATTDPNHPLRTQPLDRTIRDMTSDLPISSSIPAEMVALMQRDRNVANYVEMTKQAVQAHNREVDVYNQQNPGGPQQVRLNEVWVLRQFFQESRFNPNAVSNKGAIGISQFMPATAAQYGVTPQQLRDPKTSIDLGVKHIGRLTNQYGSQIFGLFAYSGGDRSLQYAAETLISRGTIQNRSEMTANQVIEFYRGERTRLDDRLARGQISRAEYRSAWAVETLDYITKHVAPDFDRRLYAFAVIPPVGARHSDILRVRDTHPVHGASDSPHRGVDYPLARNTPILATNQALVVHTGSHNGYGNTIILAHGHGVFEMGAHLTRSAARPGQIVKPGEVMAYSGSTGTATGPHYHHEWWIERNGRVYVVDGLSAQGKNLKDPVVQDQLIAEASTKLRGHSEATIADSIPDQYRNLGAELTDRINQSVSTGSPTLMASNTPLPGGTTR